MAVSIEASTPSPPADLYDPKPQIDLPTAIRSTANSLGVSPVDLATTISYETGGTFNPWQRGPVTRFGEHRGLIQWGEPQRQQYGVYKGMPVAEQMQAVGRYLQDAGVKPGSSLLDIYSAINAGHVGRPDAVDSGTTVAQKVAVMGAHRAKAEAFLGGTFTPPPPTPEYSPEGDVQTPGAGFIPPAPHSLGAPNPYAPPSGTPIDPSVYGNSTPDVLTSEERAQRAANPYGFFSAIPAAAATDWTTSWLLRDMGGQAPDPSFSYPLKQFNQDIKDHGVPEEYHGFLASSVSEADRQDRLQTIQEDVTRDQRFAHSGLPASVARLVTGMFDPVTLAAGVASDGIATGMTATMKLGRLARSLLEGTAIGTGNAALTEASRAVNPKITDSDVLQSFGMGMFLGGAVGALRHNPAVSSEADGIARVGRQIMDNHATANPGFDYGMSAAGAASSVNPHSFILGDRPELDNVPEIAMSKWRFDSNAILGRSKSAVARLVGPYLGEEPVGFKDKSTPIPDPAMVKATVMDEQAKRDYATVTFPAFQKWADEQGVKLTMGNKAQMWDQFHSLVGEHVETPNPPADVSPHVAAGAGEFRRIMGQYADRISNPAIDRGGIARPVSEIQRDAHYFPKFRDNEGLNTALETFGFDRLKGFVTRAVLASRPEMAPEMAARIGKGWLTNMSKAGYGIADGADYAIAHGDREALKEAFAGTNLTSEELDAVFDQVDSLKKPEGDGAGFSRTKRRTLLDYTHSENIGGNTISMRDFFSKNADLVLRRYSRITSGKVALADMQIRDPKTGELIIDGIRSPSEFQKVLNWVKEEHAELPGLSAKEKNDGGERAVKELQYLHDAVAGVPHYNTQGQMATWMRRVKKFGVIRLMNRLGINQAQEFSRMFGSIGTKAMLQQMPAFGRALETLADGAERSVPKDALARELESAGAGARSLEMHFPVRARYHDEEMIGASYGGAGRKIDEALNRGTELTSLISGMTHIHSIQQRWAASAISQRIYDMAVATGGEDLSKLKATDVDKLRSLGFSDETLKAVFKEMLKHGTAAPQGSKLVGIGLENWKPETRARFVNSLYRWTDRAIHRNEASSLNRWLSDPTVSMLTQFRTFALGSWAKSMLYNMHHFDSRTFATMLSEVIAGAGTYALTYGMSHAFDPDLGKEAGKRLSPKGLALAGFSRAGFTSMLPGIFDTALAFTPAGAQFDYRTSGAPTSAFFGSPAVDLVSSLAQFSSGAMDAAYRGRPLSRQEIQAGARSLPFGNWLPFSATMSWLASDNPNTAPHPGQ